MALDLDKQRLGTRGETKRMGWFGMDRRLGFGDCIGYIYKGAGLIVHRLDKSVLFGREKLEPIILLSCFHLNIGYCPDDSISRTPL